MKSLTIDPQLGDVWAAMIVADRARPPTEPGPMKRSAFFGETPMEAERQTRAYLGASEPAN